MKYAVKTLLTILGVVGLCSCESLPVGDPFDQGEYVPSRDQALYHAYNGWRGELGEDVGNIKKMNTFYSSNW
jgi:hypothetical protein